MVENFGQIEKCFLMDFLSTSAWRRPGLKFLPRSKPYIFPDKQVLGILILSGPRWARDDSWQAQISMRCSSA